jgi:hypothetical protein
VVFIHASLIWRTVMVYNLDWKDCQKIAERACYWAGIHREDRKDFIQDALVEMMERARLDSGGLSTKELWRAARCVRSRYWRAYKKARRITSLNVRVRDTTIELHETIADDKTVDLDALLDAKSHLENLPPGIVCVGKKLVKEDPLTKNQRHYLHRFQEGEVKPNKGMENYHRLRVKGLCVTCGEESGNFAQCPGCQEKHRAFQKKHRKKKGTAWIKTLRDHWRKQGRCPRCGGIPEPGHKTCPICLAKNRKYLQRHRERRAIEFMEEALV